MNALVPGDILADDSTTRPVPRWRRRYITAIVLSLALVVTFFVILYSSARRDLIEQVRNHARFAAICLAHEIAPADVAAIQQAADTNLPAYTRIQASLQRFHKLATDVRFAYVLRRKPGPRTAPTDYLFVADLPAEDKNGNGSIDAYEKSESPGTPYDAAPFPAMVHAWNEPDADRRVTSDPPYPDSLSGYAPVRDTQGHTVAIAGVDITADIIGQALFLTRLSMLTGCAAFAILIAVISVLFLARHDAFLELQALNRRLQEQNRRLENATAMRADLSHMIVHDIRNTLTVAATCGGMLPQETEHLPPERQADARELIHNLNQCVDRTIHYLNDMLVLAKSESGRLVPQLHDLDLRDLLTGTARHCEPIAQPARISIAVENPSEPLPVRGDVHLLTRTLDNLLLNAIKYSPPGGVVRLRAELAGARTPGEAAGRIQVCVADEGGGVHPSVRQHLFQAFASDTREMAHSRPIGLGLAFCKMAVEAHHGRIRYEDAQPGPGSLFVIELP